MAKKAQLHSKKLKSGKIQIYKGTKVAHGEDRKAFIKSHYKSLKPDKLSKEDAQYLGRYKGGKTRSDNALTLGGKFVSKKFVKQTEKLTGVDLEALKNEKGYKTLKKMFEAEPELKEAFSKLLDTGLTFWHTQGPAIEKVENHKGTIEVNGEKATSAEAAKMINDVLFTLHRKFTTLDATIKIKYSGVKKMIIELPAPSFMKELKRAHFNERLSEMLEIINSQNYLKIYYAKINEFIFIGE